MKQSNESHIKYKEKVKLGKSDELNLICDKCGETIDGKNVNINSSLAKCNNCNSVFNIKEDLFFLSDRKGRPEMITPAGTDVLELSDSLDIRLDWLKSHPQGTLGFLTFFTAIWNGILALAVVGALVAGSFEVITFMSVHLLIGMGLLYYLSTIYLNYTDIIVNRSYIEISHRPLKNPFLKSKKIGVDELEQLYVSKYVASTTNGNPNYAYALYATLKTNGRKIQLIKGMNRETQLYLEQEIERYLRIKDRPIEDAVVS